MSSEQLAPHSTIAIAGGGLLGRLLAWQLLEAGHHVSVYEQGSFTQSSSAAHTAAGMISPLAEAIDTEPLMYDLGMVAIAQWPIWLQQLSVSTSHTVQYGEQGSMIVAHPRDQALLQQYTHDMQRQLPQSAQVHTLDRQGIAALESDVAEHFQQGLLFPQEAHIDNRQLLHVLLERIQQLGGQCIENTSVDVEPYTIREVSNGQQHTFDCVIDCRGVGAKPQWKNVRGVRGEILRVSTQEVQLSRPIRLLHPRYQLYIVPKPDNEYVIGATQIESEDTSSVSVQSALELNSALYTVNPAFAEARIIEMQSNLRPALNDNRPQIQHQNGMIKVNGLYRHGYLLAPTVVQYTLALLLDVVANDTHVSDSNFSDILYANMHNKPCSTKELDKEKNSAHVIA